MSRARPRAAALALALLAATTTPACGRSAPGAGGQQVTVLAAASLKEPFTALARELEARRPGTQVVLSFGPSPSLAQQVVSGAPADVLATASTTAMRPVLAAGRAAGPVPFAANRAAVVTPAADPGRVRSLADLARPGVEVATCRPQVPCGAVAQAAFRNAGVPVRPVTQEPDVKAVLTKVLLGEVDAGAVYVSDAVAAGSRVRRIDVPAGPGTATTYPVTVVTGAPHRAGAQAFVDLVVSARGRQVLAAAGFSPPPAPAP